MAIIWINKEGGCHIKVSKEVVNGHYSVSNYLKLDIAGLEPKGTSCGNYKMNDYIIDYYFSDSFKLNSGRRTSYVHSRPYYSGYYLLANISNNTLKSSDKYHESNGIILSIDYIEFLQFLKQTGITLKTTYNGRDDIQYEFLSYPNFIES